MHTVWSPGDPNNLDMHYGTKTGGTANGRMEKNSIIYEPIRRKRITSLKKDHLKERLDDFRDILAEKQNLFGKN